MILHRTLLILTATLAVGGPLIAQADDNDVECRGIAAGVVATLRASGEITGQEASEAAILAARRACAAARATPASQGPATPSTELDTEDANAVASKEEPTVWELLSRDRELKPGNKRLRRLKQQ